MKKHWYKDMHYAEFAEDEVCSPASLASCRRLFGRELRVS